MDAATKADGRMENNKEGEFFETSKAGKEWECGPMGVSYAGSTDCLPISVCINIRRLFPLALFLN